MDDYTFEKRKKVINELIHDKYYTPMKGKEIAMLLNVSKENRNDLYKVLDALVLEGKIGVTSKGKYCKNDKNILTGIFQSTDRGFGFVTVEGEDEDIFIPKDKIRSAVTGHKVVVKINSFGDDTHNPEGEVIRILGHVNDPGTDILSVV